MAGGVGVKCPRRKPVGIIFRKIMSSPHLAQLRLTPARDHVPGRGPFTTEKPGNGPGAVGGAREGTHESSHTTTEQYGAVNRVRLVTFADAPWKAKGGEPAPGTQNSNLQHRYATGWLDKHRCYGRSKLEMVLLFGGGGVGCMSIKVDGLPNAGLGIRFIGIHYINF